MFFRMTSKAGSAVPATQQTVQQIHSQLQQQQQLWTQRLAQDPAAFSALEEEVHLHFGQLADRLVASLLAGVAALPALSEVAKKK